MADENELLTPDDLDLGTDQPDATGSALEDKYREQMRQILPQKIELPISTLPAMVQDQIDLNPDFQRRDRWNTERQSRFIESIIMNVPIPPVFLGEDEYGAYVVLDGRQRLTAVNEFLLNSYQLEKLEVWKELNGKRFNDLKKIKFDKTLTLDRILTRRFLPAVLLLKESSSQVKYDVFDRLNTGAVMAEPMEIRNAVFRGKFNDLIRKLSDNLHFRELWGIPTDDTERLENKNYQKMVDIELVLRFFALRDHDSMSSRFKEYLSLYMADRNKFYAQHPEAEAQDEQHFLWAVNNCWRVLGGEGAFRRPNTGNRSAPLADAYMVALSSVDPATLADEATARRVERALRSLPLNDADFKNAIGTGTNGKGAISIRIQKAKDAVAAALSA